MIDYSGSLQDVVYSITLEAKDMSVESPALKTYGARVGFKPHSNRRSPYVLYTFRGPIYDSEGETVITMDFIGDDGIVPPLDGHDSGSGSGSGMDEDEDISGTEDDDERHLFCCGRDTIRGDLVPLFGDIGPEVTALYVPKRVREAYDRYKEVVVQSEGFDCHPDLYHALPSYIRDAHYYYTRPVDVFDARHFDSLEKCARFATGKHKSQEKTNLEFVRIVKSTMTDLSDGLGVACMKAAVDLYLCLCLNYGVFSNAYGASEIKGVLYVLEIRTGLARFGIILLGSKISEGCDYITTYKETHVRLFLNTHCSSNSKSLTGVENDEALASEEELEDYMLRSWRRS
ncbi:hypothetical protein Tsubulata_026002 [Turnera subulata]|uniref:Uncharacterized protein n=1 Tax=Turnera subulata TaxID=218843 RepID=A0A9Q0FIC5_9ROSI|nr:hypothetical protein Tsubulata_026002 [Turnera subulata]